MSLITLPARQDSTEVNLDDPLNKGLVAWYPFRQNGGDVLRDVAGDLPATFESSEYAKPFWKSLGILDNAKCLAFPHSGGGYGYLESGAVNTDLISVSVWVNTSEANRGGVQISKRSSTSGADYAWELSTGSTGIPYFGPNDNAYRATGPAISGWAHVVGVYNGSSVYVAVNGVVHVSGSLSYSGALNQNNVPITIGKRSLVGSEAYYNGSLSDIRIYDRGLAFKEIHDLYVASRTGYRSQFKRRTIPVSTPSEVAPPTFSPAWAIGSNRTIQSFSR